jgi:hypothetical protein
MASNLLGRSMKRRKTFQHPDQLELGLLFQAGEEAGSSLPAADDQGAADAASVTEQQPKEQQPERRPRRRIARKGHTESEPEFAQLHETGWQAGETPSLLDYAQTAAEPESQSLAALEPEPAAPGIQEPRLWSDDAWTVRVIRDENGHGWAAEIQRSGDTEPALVCPWETDRDKNPKPLDGAAFDALVKAAADMRRRQELQLRAMLHKSVTVQTRSSVITVTLDIVPDEDDSHALLAAVDESGTQLAEVRVAPGFKLSQRTASAWVDSGYRKVERLN